MKRKEIKKYPIHFKFNTGLNRLGFNFSDISDLANLINNSKEFKLISILSHLAASEDLNEKDFTRNQIDSFNKIFNELTKHINTKPIRHLCNTSGIFNYPDAHYEMVRCGISLYGFGNAPVFDKHLKPISTLKTTISQFILTKRRVFRLQPFIYYFRRNKNSHSTYRSRRWYKQNYGKREGLRIH